MRGAQRTAAAAPTPPAGRRRQPPPSVSPRSPWFHGSGHHPAGATFEELAALEGTDMITMVAAEAGGTTSSDGELVRRALEGDSMCWEVLARRHWTYLLAVARSYRVGEDAQDVVQVAWLRLLTHAGSIRDTDRVRSWLAAVVRHECLRLLSTRRREQLADDEQLFEVASQREQGSTPEQMALQGEARALVRKAFAALPERQQALLALLDDPETSDYRVASTRLGMPRGSIGPTRQRGLRRLRRNLTDLGYDPQL
jgi:RNA polymerase sigma factor (sigma-70 family)